jgi:hypothetical protein
MADFGARGHQFPFFCVSLMIEEILLAHLSWLDAITRFIAYIRS